MRFALSSLLLVAGLASAATAEAQVFRVKPMPPGHARKLEKGKPAGDPAACAARQSVLRTEEQRQESLQVEYAGIDAEMAQLQRRLEELKKRRQETADALRVAERRVQAMQDMYRRDCRGSESCSMYEQQAAALGNQASSVEVELAGVRDEIGRSRSVIGGLQQRIAPLQSEYAEKRCNDLVPGETAQHVIDRCTAIFSDWNRLQGELNRQNARVPELKSRYQQLFTELQNFETRAAGYEQYLARNCSASPETEKMRAYTKKREQAKTVGQELDALIADLTRLRGVKITVKAD